jgi:hypothetical protein
VHIVDKQTPLEIAYDYGNIKVVELLVPQIMIKINARDKLSIIGEHINNLINGYVHNKMGQTQFLCSFEKDKDLKLEIEMACNHCTICMVKSHISLVQYILIIKFSFFDLQLIFILSKSYWKKIANFEFYNVFIYQF